MMAHEDVHFQLVDLPAISPEHRVPWLANALQTADAGLLVVDLGDPACVEQMQSVLALLRKIRVTLDNRWDEASTAAADLADEDPFALVLPTLMLANKADQIADVEVELEAFRELTGLRFPSLAVSASTGAGLQEVGSWLFSHLGIVRVYTKTPGKPAEKERPFTLRRGQRIEDVARLVHKDLVHSLKYARVWGRTGIAGQHVGREHTVDDGDVVELHA